MATRLKTGRGRGIAFAAVGLGIVTLTAAAVVLKDPLLGEWYIRKLASPRAEERKAAAEKLGEMRSAKAVPYLLQLIDRREKPQVDSSASGTVIYDVPDLLTGEDYSCPEESAFLIRVIQEDADASEARSWGAHLALTATPADHAGVARVLETLRIIRGAIGKIGERAVPELSKAAGSRSASPLVRDLASVEFIALLRDLRRRQELASLQRIAADRYLDQDFRRWTLQALAQIKLCPRH